MCKHRLLPTLILAALLAAWAAPVGAQETTATVTGVVADQTGAVVPGVTVVVKHTATGRTWETITNETGRYSVLLLPVGEYEATFQLSGFQPVTLKGIVLHVNDRIEIPVKLTVGGIAEAVEVLGATPLVQPIPSVQGIISQTQVQELPLNNRNFVQLATLVPGVSSDLSDEVGVGLTSLVSLSINGARRNAVNWLVDGVSNVDVGSNITLLSTPTLESIEEFTIITSSYAAEWPRSGGGIVNVVTKSGTSSFAGSAYDFFRHDALNANTFFRQMSTNADTRANPPMLRYNNFGYTVGGPVVPMREKMFFFFSEEWRRITRAPAATTANVPDPAWLTDPANVNYVAPELRDPNAVKLLAAWPAPNIAGKNQYISDYPNLNNTRQEVLRLDYDFKPNWRLTGRYTHDDSLTREAGGLWFSTAVPGVATTDTSVPGNVLGLQLRTLWGNRLNELSYQMSGNKITNVNPAGTRSQRADYALNVPELYAENADSKMPTIVVTGTGTISTIGARQPANIVYWNHTVTDNLTWQRANHTVKTGVLLTFEQKNENSGNETQGRFTFVAAGGRTGFQNFLMGNADGRCGTGCTYAESQIDITNHLRFNRYEAYAQDTWRPRSNVTVDVGIRYAYYPPVTDANNILTTFSPSAYNAANAPAFTDATGGSINLSTGSLTNGIWIAGQNSPYGRAVYGSDKNNFQPRIGVTWDPKTDGRTVVRAGYGIYYDQPLIGIFEQNAFTNPPFNFSTVILNPSLSNPGGGQARNTSGVLSLIGSGDPFGTPRTMQWNVGMQRQLYSRGVIDVSYVGARGDGLIRPVDINIPQPKDVVALGNANLARPYKGYGTINIRETTARSRYHGLLTSFRHDGGRYGSMTLNYTLSRNRTDSSNDRDAVDLPQDPLNKEFEYADARTDRRHIFSASYMYEIPFFRESGNAVLRNVIGGWQISGITNINSGAPIPRLTANTNSFKRGSYVNQVGDPKAGQMSGLYWFDPAAFVPASDGQWGTTPRALFRLPGRHQWDLSVSKNWYFGARRIQFRADMINAFNQTQFTGVNAACGASATGTSCVVANSTFGQFTSTRAQREIQLGLKFYW